MDKHNPLPFLLLVFLQCLAEHIQLIIQHFSISHTGSVIQQFMDMQVDLHNFILYHMLLFLQLCRYVLHVLLQQRILDVVSRNIYLLYRFIILDNLINQGRFLKKVGRLESMQLVKLHDINAQLLIHRLFQ